jgi:hypothetical protein
MHSTQPSQITDAIIKEIRGSLSTLYFQPSDFFILRKIVYLSILHSHNSPKRTIYATPGEAWLSQHTGLHRVTISRRVSFLSDKGFLAITYRRKLQGQWQTNLYKFGKILWAIIQDVTRRFKRFFNRVTPTLHIVTLDRINTTSKVKSIIHDTELKTVIDRIENKLHLKKGSPPADDH